MNDPYLFINEAVSRLCQDFRTHGGLIVGFDFDDTVYDFHNKGHQYPEVVELLRRAHNMGCILVCYTGNTDAEVVIGWCQAHEVTFQRESPIINNGKPYFNILLDDRAGLPSAFVTLKRTLDIIAKETTHEN